MEDATVEAKFLAVYFYTFVTVKGVKVNLVGVVGSTVKSKKSNFIYIVHFTAQAIAQGKLSVLYKIQL